MNGQLRQRTLRTRKAAPRKLKPVLLFDSVFSSQTRFRWCLANPVKLNASIAVTTNTVRCISSFLLVTVLSFLGIRSPPSEHRA